MKKQKIAIYVFVDAFGWEIYKEFGFLSALLPNSRKLQTTFGFSSAADPSILTGRYPDEHTHWSSFIYDPKASPFKWMKFLAALPPAIFDRWRVRHNLSKIIKLVYGYTGYFQLYSVPFRYLPYFDYLEKKDYFVPGGILKTDTIFDWCVEHKINYYCSNWRHSEDLILKENIEEIRKGEINFAYVYLPKLDAVMHEHGPFSEATQSKLRTLESNIINLFEVSSQIYEQVSLYVISDHGMAPVTGAVDLMKSIESLKYTYGKDYVAFYDSTMARMWFFNSMVKKDVMDLLKSLDSGSIVENDELESLRVRFPHQKFGEVFFLMNEGILINPSFMGLSVIAGMHGYHPSAIHSYALMLSNRDIPVEINSITDIRKTMEYELEQ